MSDFGKGFVYCLVNFAKHFDRVTADIMMYEQTGINKWNAYDIWINGASDHLFELELPENLPDEIKTKIRNFQNEVLDYGHGTKMMAMTEDKYREFRDRLNDICLMIDDWLGVKCEKAEWD